MPVAWSEDARLHPELAGGGAQHVGRDRGAGGIEALAVGQHRLALGAEGAERQAQLVGRRRGHAALGQADQAGPSPGRPSRPGAGFARSTCTDRLRPVKAAKGFCGDWSSRDCRRSSASTVRAGAGAGRAALAISDQHQERHADEEQHQAREHARDGEQELLHEDYRLALRRANLSLSRLRSMKSDQTACAGSSAGRARRRRHRSTHNRAVASAPATPNTAGTSPTAIAQAGLEVLPTASRASTV